MKRILFALIGLAAGLAVSYAEEVTLTVYNNDLAIVKMTDTMSFKKGRQTVSLAGVVDRLHEERCLYDRIRRQRASRQRDGCHLYSSNQVTGELP